MRSLVWSGSNGRQEEIGGIRHIKKCIPKLTGGDDGLFIGKEQER